MVESWRARNSKRPQQLRVGGGGWGDLRGQHSSGRLRLL